MEYNLLCAFGIQGITRTILSVLSGPSTIVRPEKYSIALKACSLNMVDILDNLKSASVGIVLVLIVIIQ